MGGDRIRRLPSVHLIEQARLVSLADAVGLSTEDIARQLNVSRPRVSQIRKAIAELQPYIGNAEPLSRLKTERDQLDDIRTEILALLKQIQRDLKELDSEAETVEIDRLLGLRTPKER